MRPEDYEARRSPRRDVADTTDRHRKVLRARQRYLEGESTIAELEAVYTPKVVAEAIRSIPLELRRPPRR